MRPGFRVCGIQLAWRFLMRHSLQFAFTLMVVGGLSLPSTPRQAKGAPTASPHAQKADWPAVSTDHVREVWINLTQWRLIETASHETTSGHDGSDMQLVVRQALKAVVLADLAFTQALMQSPGGVTANWTQSELFTTALTCDVLLGRQLISESQREPKGAIEYQVRALGETIQQLTMLARKNGPLISVERSRVLACARSMAAVLERGAKQGAFELPSWSGITEIAAQLRTWLEPLSSRHHAVDQEDSPVRDEPLFLRVLDAQDFVGESRRPRRSSQNWIGSKPASVLLDTLTAELSIDFAATEARDLKLELDFFLGQGLLPTAFAQLDADRLLVAGVNPYTLFGRLIEIDLDWEKASVKQVHSMETWNSFTLATALELLPNQAGVVILDQYRGLVTLLERNRWPVLVVDHSQNESVPRATALALHSVATSGQAQKSLEVSLLSHAASKEAVGLFSKSNTLLVLRDNAGDRRFTNPLDSIRPEAEAPR